MSTKHKEPTLGKAPTFGDWLRFAWPCSTDEQTRALVNLVDQATIEFGMTPWRIFLTVRSAIGTHITKVEFNRKMASIEQAGLKGVSNG